VEEDAGGVDDGREHAASDALGFGSRAVGVAGGDGGASGLHEEGLRESAVGDAAGEGVDRGRAMGRRWHRSRVSATCHPGRLDVVFFWLLFLFIAVPLAEIWLIGQVWGAIGGVETIALLLVVSVLGAMLVKQQGLSVLDRIQGRLESGSMPTDELIDGGLILFAGALMLTPGFITDAVGLLLLLPPSRAVLRSVVGRRFRHRIEAATVSGTSAGFSGSAGPGVGFSSWTTSSTARDGFGPGPGDGTIDLDDDAIVEDRLVDEPGDEGPPRIDRP
jgi:UPF0716 protein FxsA